MFFEPSEDLFKELTLFDARLHGQDIFNYIIRADSLTYRREQAELELKQALIQLKLAHKEKLWRYVNFNGKRYKLAKSDSENFCNYGAWFFRKKLFTDVQTFLNDPQVKLNINIRNLALQEYRHLRLIIVVLKIEIIMLTVKKNVVLEKVSNILDEILENSIEKAKKQKLI